ncbi:MAG: cell division protein FtsX [Chitinispirillaceae bacterium]
MGKLIYFFVEAVRGFYQAKLMTFVSIMTITATLFLISGVFIGLMNIDDVLKRSESQADIVVYFTETASGNVSAQKELFSEIRQMPEVSSAALVDKDSAWKRFRAQYGEEMLEAVDENPFPASVELVLKEGYRGSEKVRELQGSVSTLSGVESVQYSREWLDYIKKIRDRFYIVSAVVGFIVFLALHSIVSNTIKLTIYARRDLVRNMHYVGATDLFIKMPFLLEGMLQGLIGGVLCIVALFIARIFMTQFSLNWCFSYLPFIVFIGVLFGWLGSKSAVRKFLV